MAGENVLPVSLYPDEFHTVTAVIDQMATYDSYLYYAERDTVLDAAFFVCSVDTGATNAIEIVKCVSDATLTGEDMQLPGAGQGITNNLDIDDSPAGNIYTFTVDTAHNLVPAGYSIAIDATSLDDIKGAVIQLRLRTRLK